MQFAATGCGGEEEKRREGLEGRREEELTGR